MNAGDDEGRDHREDMDRWLRETLDDAVADVEPRHDLDQVRARLEEGAVGRRRRPRWAAGVAGLAVAATVAAVAFASGIVGADPDPNDPAAGWSPPPSATPDATPPDDASPTPDDASPTHEGTPPRLEGPLPVYYVGDTPAGPRLYREFRAPTTERGDALATAVQMALELAPLDPDYRTPWPAGLRAGSTYADGLLTVDLTAPFVDVELVERPSAMSQDEARMAVQQLIYTAQAAVQERAPVRFLLDGRPLDRLLGQPVAEPLAADDPMQVQAPVWIITPQQGDDAAGSLQVDGRGAFFEANVSWQVLQGDRVVKEGFATAQECCALSPYSFEVTGLPPGDYVLRVYDADMSGGEGPGEHEDTKSVTVTG